ncbi:tRNA guanosine(34) transglycosylase Tgt [Candidatus Parcubacteria bacterium]|nr:MAG: tRNA guanosine(34) transglycosylase Tgt [Candidatus Parcubacteria bacterium]
MIEFKVIKKSNKSRARIGILKTTFGEIETPSLVTVATQGVVKTLDSREVKETKTQVLISNTFHLHLRPGEDVVKKNGGLHKFMNWDGPLMTDSGGFQVFSLGFGKDFGIGKILKEKPQTEIKIQKQPKMVKIMEDGVSFRSPIDGKLLFLGPKESIKIQEKLGADIIFAFDECPPPNASYDYMRESVARTHRWAKASLDSKKTKQALYGIVQGGEFKDLRIESANFLSALPFDGFGIGGEFGYEKEKMSNMLGWVTDKLPENKPRHLLGVGYLEDIPTIVTGGMDTFDCTVPTHFARHGVAFTSEGRIDMGKSKFLNDLEPLDKNCKCMVCQYYKRSYIAHLFKAREITALKFLSFHNLFYFNTVVEQTREDIKRGKI